MNTQFRFSIIALCIASVSYLPTAYAVDAEAANALAKQNNCFTCHGLDKDKVGPSFTKLGQKFKPLADGKDKILTHLANGGAAKNHLVIKSDDVEQTKNLADWIISLGN